MIHQANDDAETATIAICQLMPIDRWCITISYNDGTKLMSTQTYATENEPTQAALTWAMQNMVPEKNAPSQ
jgi:hypothetical protein